ncbi:LytR family transcriptional regulator [Planomicrobium sp. CPCC 101110]|nr:LytR family transcriptional regulator [Planomicrobium sp. CPCC 101110]
MQKHPREDEQEILYAETADSLLDEINILLIGSDRRNDENGLSDALLVANYNPETNGIKLISFMRDTYVDVPGHGMQKINAAHAFGGPELVNDTIHKNFGIEPDFYASVDFDGFPKLFDLIIPSGIEVDIPYEMSHGIGLTLEPGLQKLQGEQLLGYVRFRNDRKSDFGRVERQQEILTAVKKQGLSFHTLMNFPKILEAIDAYIDTDIERQVLWSIGKSLIQDGSGEMETLRIPAAETYTNERVDAGEVLSLDFEANKEILSRFLSNSSLSKGH